MRKRIDQIDRFRQNPHEVQIETFRNLLDTAKNTEWGKRYGFEEIKSWETFKERVPVSSYEQLFPEIDRMMKGEQNILWPTKITWFAKSSGTTNARSKFIPVSKASLEDCHYKGGKDMLAIYVNNRPDTKLFTGKGLSIGGSFQVNEKNPNSFYGDVSAVIMQNLPFWAEYIRAPKLKTALMDKWEEKIERIAEETISENITSLAGVPTWTYVLLQRIMEKTGKTIPEVWPNLELFGHGAVAFGPYRELFKAIIPTAKMNYLELYNASEGFFGIQDQPDSEDLLLMLDYGVFYEFIPAGHFDDENPITIPLSEVEIGKNYAMVISTNGGLWRYKIGDTVKFTSTDPYRFRISGRTKHYINAFGEEVIIENAEAALTEACKQTGAKLSNFTAAPVYFQSQKQGGHEWIIEFNQNPDNLSRFCAILDAKLREINSDYDAKRYQDIALVAPKVHVAPPGTFVEWLRRKNKLGGQNKVPRLSNTREYLEELLVICQETHHAS
ncbi:GH3 auxin-responsive promoter family protein [Adhaeribacter sp. BT258]|uniref:GH3 auxin-responsive promoter family protein n=1 Tax=Adhaeribacter terrigena TaxID=2793070 RepID=A0ABS1C2A3_9BACT|nr:GH3 auxin-responsive promoter family protein [Adhaeribacter terrigena]MBK0403517.1 GH3 auxin-responsive promoter family protein [Adhaeribacter terrigena]